MNKKKKNTFANRIIALCVFMCSIITVVVLAQYWRLYIALPAGVIGTLVGFWGGELLIIALRQIFGSDVVEQSKKTKEKPSSEDDEFKI